MATGRQSNALGKEVCQQFLLRGRALDRVIDLVLGTAKPDELNGNDLGPLMEKLEEGMLPIGARLPPDDRPGFVRNRAPQAVHRFAVTLHVALLQMGGKTVQNLTVRKDRQGGMAKHVMIPNTQ